MAIEPKLHGLQKLCRLYGRMKCGTVMMVWDYKNEKAVPEQEMKPGSKRWQENEQQKWKYFQWYNTK